MKLGKLFKRETKSQKDLRNYFKRTFGVSPRDLRFYEVALTHSSVLPFSKADVQSNERLEFLGDAILDSVVAEYLYQKFTESTEGELTKMKAKIVSRKNINNWAVELGIDEVLNHSISANSKNTSILGNAFEAIIGAVHLDLGYFKVEHVIISLLNKSNLEEILSEHKDYKSLLHEWCQQSKKDVVFSTVKEEQIGHRIHYTINVIIDGKVVSMSTAASKKKAQHQAAKFAYTELKLD